jgi:iron complex outermembrane receptor protein
MVRYSGDIGSEVSYRVYNKYFSRNSFVNADGDKQEDGWNTHHSGIRIDWKPSDDDYVEFYGDALDGALNESDRIFSMIPPYRLSILDKGGMSASSMQCRWSHISSPSVESKLQIYYDKSIRDAINWGSSVSTVDIDFLQHDSSSQRHELMWGLGYRYISDHIRNNILYTMTPEIRRTQMFNAFVQDEISLVPNKTRLTIGSKFEHNDYTNFEIQPSARLLWTPDPKHTLWAAVSKVLRTPSRAEEDLRLTLTVNGDDNPSDDPPDNPNLYIAAIRGNPDLRSEELVAYELGYRAQRNKNFFLDIAAFYNDYDKLVTVDPGIPVLEQTPSYNAWVVFLDMSNNMKGHTNGLEMSANWQVRDWWRIVASYTYLHTALKLQHGSSEIFTATGTSPTRQAVLWSSIDLPGGIEIDPILRYASKLPDLNVNVPQYLEMDLRIAWKLKRGPEISVVGRNLLHKRHREFATLAWENPAAYVPREIYTQLVWRF